jgi:hypothetical protein
MIAFLGIHSACTVQTHLKANAPANSHAVED